MKRRSRGEDSSDDEDDDEDRDHENDEEESQDITDDSKSARPSSHSGLLLKRVQQRYDMKTAVRMNTYRS